jgi:NDP-sugar pyrophosphorylase family protein
VKQVVRAVILAAGRGTRLGDLTKTTPKPMISVAGRPILQHIIERVARAGVREFVIVTRYLGHVIREFVGDGTRFGVRAVCVEQGEEYGTGAALQAAKPHTGDGPVMMTYGDIATPAVNYAGALASFSDLGCDAVITLNWVDDPYRGAAVYLDSDGKVSNIVEKPPRGRATSHWNSAGIFVFTPVIFDYLDRLELSSRGEKELPAALNSMIRDGLAVCPYYLQGGWLDIGRPEDVVAAERLFDEERAK